MRRLLIESALLALSSVLALTLTLADASVRRERIHVSPSSGSPSTVFVLTFRAPERTGRNGSSQRHDLVTASALKGAAGCITSIDLRAPDARSGARVRVSLDPRNLGGSWCPGAYHGRIAELQGPACRPGKLCPTYLLMRGIVGRFTLHVKRGAQSSTGGSSGTPPAGTSLPPPGTSPPPSGMPPPGGTDTTPPTFAGLQKAFTCSPEGEPWPYELTWQAATDDVTPSSQIVYDVFYATHPGGEDFSQPTWTTSPGVTSFKTPPLHEPSYFVVRARDQAGNEDQSTVERANEHPCV